MATSALPTPFSAYTPFNQPAEFHLLCSSRTKATRCASPECRNTCIECSLAQTDFEQCSLGDTNVTFVDLNAEDKDIITGMSSWINNIVSKYSVDGVRIDTVKLGKSPRAFASRKR